MSKTKIVYNYMIEITDIVDGDTVKANIDLGWDIWKKNQTIRLDEIDSPEIHSENLLEAKAGSAVKTYVEKLFPIGTKTILKSNSLDKYGRVLGGILLPDGTDLSDVLLAKKVVKPYSGEKKQLWTEDQLNHIIEILSGK